MNKQILLVADSPGWAFDFLAQDLAAKLDGFTATIDYITNIKADPEHYDIGHYDLVYFFSWFDAVRFSPRLSGFNESKICVGVHSIESWLKRDWPIELVKSVCECFAATGFISKEIGQLLEVSNGHYTPNGVNPSTFPPQQIQPDLPLKCLWVGNPSGAHHGDIKGFNDFIEPVLGELSPRAELIVASPENFFEHQDMHQFYHQGHVLICMSSTEGCPLPVVEAMHCGLPVITTRVGVVPELVEHDKSGWVIPRDRSALKDAVNHLIENPDLLASASNAAIKAAEPWTDERMALAYKNMFEAALERLQNQPKHSSRLSETVFNEAGAIGSKILASWKPKVGAPDQDAVNEFLTKTFAEKDGGRLKAKPNYINSVLSRLSRNILFSGVNTVIHTDVGYGEMPLLVNCPEFKQLAIENKKTKAFAETEAGLAVIHDTSLAIIEPNQLTQNTSGSVGVVIPVINADSIGITRALAEQRPILLFVILRSETVSNLLEQLKMESVCWSVLNADEKIAVLRADRQQDPSSSVG